MFNVFSGLAAVSANDSWGVGTGPLPGAGCGAGGGGFIEHWDGSRWSVVPLPSPAPSGADFSFASVAAASSHDVLAAGSFRPYAAGQSPGVPPLIEPWGGGRGSI